jgi:hypothetical protein
MSRWSVAGALLLGVCLVSPAKAENFEQYCSITDFASPVRQTIVVLDDALLYPEGGEQPDKRNVQWRHFLGNLVLSEQSTMEQTFLPRERVTVAIARRDGAGLRPVFAGCLPFYSADEKRKIKGSAGNMDSLHEFFGTGPIADAKKGMNLYRIRFASALRDALQPTLLSPPAAPRGGGDLGNNGFVNSLKGGSLVNFAYGIPRILLVSDMARFLGGFPADRPKARALALKKAQSADLNFRGAEIYVVGASANAVARDALEMFFLASHGELLSIGPVTAIPQFAPAPAHVACYQGLVQYPDNRFPIRLRLATDENGTSVNSWISVQTSREQFNPVHGVLTCPPNRSCLFTGDDVFAQAWNANRGTSNDPLFDQNLPFAGARSLKFSLTGSTINGSISDTLLHFKGVRASRLEFTASRQSNGRC